MGPTTRVDHSDFSRLKNCDLASEQIMTLFYSIPYFDMTHTTRIIRLISFSSTHIICCPMVYVTILPIAGTSAHLGSGPNLIWSLYLFWLNKLRLIVGTGNINLTKYIWTVIILYICIYIYYIIVVGWPSNIDYIGRRKLYWTRRRRVQYSLSESNIIYIGRSIIQY